MRLQKILHEKDTTPITFFSETMHSQQKELIRNGLFDAIFNKFFDPHFKGIPHLLCSKFEIFNDQQLYYHFKTHAPPATEKGILLISINPVLSSLDLLRDSLLFAGPKQWKAFYSYDVDLSVPTGQLYVSKFFQEVEKALGFIPEPLSLTDIQKQSDFQGWTVFEAGTQWTCLDNHMLHVVLSRGAALLGPAASSGFDIVEELELSPFHSLQILKRKEKGAAIDPFTNEIKKLDYFKNPQDVKIFRELIYKNIFPGKA